MAMNLDDDSVLRLGLRMLQAQEIFAIVPPFLPPPGRRPSSDDSIFIPIRDPLATMLSPDDDAFLRDLGIQPPAVRHVDILVTYTWGRRAW